MHGSQHSVTSGECLIAVLWNRHITHGDILGIFSKQVASPLESLPYDGMSEEHTYLGRGVPIT
jgi:hypothetical protein